MDSILDCMSSRRLFPWRVSFPYYGSRWMCGSNAPWFDVTYKVGKAYVVGEIQKPVDESVYPQQLFG